MEERQKVETAIQGKQSRPLVAIFLKRPSPFSNRAIIRTNVLTKFHEDWSINLNYLVLRSHVFQRIRTLFKRRDIIKINILTNLEHDADIIGTNFLTKFHGDKGINIAYRVMTMKNVDDT
ncbi:hypothetical protein DPMN_118732 [Dreissena polymorpha]|uniref:Uncharacterized protein n=1 Tax=Dreissena polymorpha TaxID=45954 RepID=A0A9D4GNM6_DREPO|nr:hypothetical protein DPMN_118732 [Dreissena polymorpha]